MNINNSSTFTKAIVLLIAIPRVIPLPVLIPIPIPTTPIKKRLLGKHLQRIVARILLVNLIYFRWMSFSKVNPSTLPGWLLCLPGRNPQ